MGAFLRAFRDTIRKIGLFLGFRFGIWGGDIGPQKILASSVDSKFDLDYDVAIKHDPI